MDTPEERREAFEMFGSKFAKLLTDTSKFRLFFNDCFVKPGEWRKEEERIVGMVDALKTDGKSLAPDAQLHHADLYLTLMRRILRRPSNPPWQPNAHRKSSLLVRRAVFAFTALRTLGLAPGLPYLPNELLFEIFWFL